MHHEYHIVHQNGSNGPYDLVALVIKIRNGSLTADTAIRRTDSEEVKPAKEWSELNEFFNQTQSNKKETHTNALKKLYLMESLKGGINFLQQNPMSTIYSSFIIIGMVLLVWAINDGMPDELHALCYVAAVIFLYFMLSCYLLLILRMVRGQQTDISHFVEKIKKVEHGWLKIIYASFLISFPIIIGIILLVSFDELAIALVGLSIIIIPGIYTITVYSFVPLLIIEHGYGVWKAMEISRASIFKSHSDNFSIYFSLNAINFIAALLMLLPMAITLPVTMSAIAESYDELFS